MMSSSVSQLQPRVTEHAHPATSAQSTHTAADVNDTPPANTPGTPPSDSSQSRAQANAHNWKNLAQQLTRAAKSLAEDAAPSAVLAHLKNTQVAIDARSDDHRFNALGSAPSVSLEMFIKHHDLPIPQTRSDLAHLAEAAHAHALQQPEGNLGGALSWPHPLTQEEQRKVRVIVDSSILRRDNQTPSSDTQTQLARGALGALIKAASLSEAQLQEPAQALQTLLKSPKAQALGQAVQDGLNGIATPTSLGDYVMAAINIGLDRESVEQPRRQSVAGFDLGQEAYWGMPAATVVDGLSRHLVTAGRVTQAEAKLATHVSLARVAPQLLVQDIPGSVVNGSQAWVNFCRAVAKIEAIAPGTASQMSYGHVMSAAQALNDPPDHITQALLLDWGVINGLVARKEDALYTPQEVETVRTAFNQQINERTTASELLGASIPSRKAIALEKLKQQFGEGLPFEEKCLTTVSDDKSKQLDGKHSMLDMAMMGINVRWKTDDSRIPIDAINERPRLNVNGEFLGQYETAVDSLEKGVKTQIRHLISELPLEDRKNLELGKIDLYQKNQYVIDTGFINPPVFRSRRNELLIRTQRMVDGKPQVCVYEVDILNSRIIKRSEAAITRGDQRNSNIQTRIEKFIPDDHDRQAPERTPVDSAPVPLSFTSARTHYLADAFFKHLDIGGHDQRTQAFGTTTLDQQKAGGERVKEFFLNLIPLRSAIVNFRQGDYESGLIDLGLDAFGLLTAGYGAGAKVAKVASTGASAAVKAAHAGRIIGGALISALNPLSGAKGLAIGTAALATQGARMFSHSGQWLINKVRGASGSYDLLKAANKEYGAAALGSYKVAEGSVDGVAVHRNGNWYAYNPLKQEAFGAPLQHFTPLNGRPGPIDAGAPIGPHHEGFKNNLERAQWPHNRADFNRGFESGDVTRLRDYYPDISAQGLIELISKPGRTAEEIGMLAKEIKSKAIENAQYASHLLNCDVDAPGVRLFPASQTHYHAHVDPASRGECAAMANTMALAIEHGKEDVFLTNLYRAADAPLTPEAQTFIKTLRTFQDVVGDKKSFHLDQTVTKCTAAQIIEDLTNSPTSKTLRIGEKDHGLLAGIKVKNGETEWFFYDPDAGLVKFQTLQSMQEGLDKALSSGLTAVTRRPYGKKHGTLTYNVSEFQARDLAADKVDGAAVAQLMTPL